MLQFAQSYVQIGQIQFAIKIYQGIMNDFECESVKLSGGLFPEISQIDIRPKEEKEIFEKAKVNLEMLTGAEGEEDFNNKKKDFELEKINSALYDKIVTSSALLLKKEYDKNTNVISAIDCLTEIVENENLNEISKIYIYEQGYSESEEKLKNTILHAITTIIGFEYRDEHFQYLENIIMTDREEKGPIALDYILKLGRFHEKFKDRVFGFVEENLLAFSKKQLSITAWYLVNLYPAEQRVHSIINAIENKAGITIYKNSKNEVEISDKAIEDERRIEKEKELERIEKYYVDEEKKQLIREQHKRNNTLLKDKRDFLTRILDKLFN
jgi:hypothetical protein